VKAWIVVSALLGTLVVTLSFFFNERLSEQHSRSQAIASDLELLKAESKMLDNHFKALSKSVAELKEILVDSSKVVQRVGDDYTRLVGEVAATKEASERANQLSGKVADLQQRIGAARIEEHRSTGAPVVRIDPK
jgi:methyl-accepting chemotaxis protein